MHKPPFVCRFVLLLFLAFTGARAQEANPYAEVPGTYSYRLDAAPTAQYRLEPKARQNVHATLERVDGLLRATPVMNPPRGFIVKSLGRALTDRGNCPDEDCRSRLVASEVWLLLYYYVKGKDGKPVWGDELNVAMHAYVNSLGATVTQRHQMHYEGIQDLAGHMMYYAPRLTRTLKGFPVYDDNVLILTKSQRPLWLPVSREMFLKSLIRDGKKSIVQIGMPGSDLDKGLHQRLERLEAEMRALTAAERQSQTWLLGTEDPLASGLVRPGTEGASPVIILNPEFFDGSKPRDSVQLIAVRLNWGTYLDEAQRPIDSITEDDHIGVRRLWTLLNETDWNKMAGMLAQP